MEYHVNLPIKNEEIKKFRIGDIIYLSGNIFTARDEAHIMLLEKRKEDIPFNPSNMGLFHCGPLMKKENGFWKVVSAGPTTSSRMEIFEDKFLEKFDVKIIIGKGGMGQKTKKALKKYICVYTSYTGGAGALAADKIKKVNDVFWLDELGMPEAIWLFKVKNFGPLVVSMDCYEGSLYEKVKDRINK